MLILWAAATLLSALISGQIARKAGADGVLYAVMALLLGPGVVPLTWEATRRPPPPRLAPILATIGLVGGFFTTLFLLCQGSFQFYLDILSGLSLALPMPTRIVCVLVHLMSTPAGTLSGFILGLWLPRIAYKSLDRRSVEGGTGETASILRAWTFFVPCLAVVLLLWGSFSFSFLLPFWQLAGPIGG